MIKRDTVIVNLCTYIEQHKKDNHEAHLSLKDFVRMDDPDMSDAEIEAIIRETIS